MPRPLRLDYEGGLYHVINRGNYRADIFASDGAKRALLTALGETCERLGWRVHAWAIMSNHYHVALETPAGNLAAGMQHWQGTFAARFNRLRKENGHIFQGRYRSLHVESGEHLGALCHYIHLNPVRARICTMSELTSWPWTSLHWLGPRKKDRPAWWSPQEALGHAGELPDSKSGHRRYVAYLKWLVEDDEARKALEFERMSKGWVIGSAQFKKALIEEHKEIKTQQLTTDPGLNEAQADLWWDLTVKLTKKLGHRPEELATSGKSAPWKLAIASALRQQTVATNRWMSEHLHLGHMTEVSRKVNAWIREPDLKLASKVGVTPNPKA